jgi:hypothetical protein
MENKKITTIKELESLAYELFGTGCSNDVLPLNVKLVLELESNDYNKFVPEEMRTIPELEYNTKIGIRFYLKKI